MIAATDLLSDQPVESFGGEGGGVIPPSRKRKTYLFSLAGQRPVVIPDNRTTQDNKIPFVGNIILNKRTPAAFESGDNGRVLIRS